MSSAAIAATANTVAPANALEFFRILGKLKTLKRTGWVNHEIPLPESVADHMYRMAMLSFMITDPAVNKDRLIKICLVHDVAEAVVGDITPYDGVSKEEKRRLEETALHSILAAVDCDTATCDIRELWLEYEDGTSPEAEVARQLDKFEMIVQADEYEKTEHSSARGLRLQRFFDTTAETFTHPEIRAWAEELRAQRRQRLQQADTIAAATNSSSTVQQP